MTQREHFDVVHRPGEIHSPTSNSISLRGRMIMSAQSSSTTRRSTHRRSRNKHELGQHITPGRPGLDELVPSRYALKVGEIDVLVISDGVVTPPAESMATNADPAVRAAWLDSMFLSRVAFDWALNAVVVRSGGRTILLDSGLGLAVPDSPRAGQLVHRLEAAGIDLASV